MLPTDSASTTFLRTVPFHKCIILAGILVKKLNTASLPTAVIANSDQNQEVVVAIPLTDVESTLNRLLFPTPTREFTQHRETYGDTSMVRSADFFYGLRPGQEHSVDLEPGVRLLIGLQAIGEADERGMRTVMTTLNGQLRPVQVRDRAVKVEVPAAERDA